LKEEERAAKTKLNLRNHFNVNAFLLRRYE